MDKEFHPTIYNRCNYLSMLGLKLIHVKTGALRVNVLSHLVPGIIIRQQIASSDPAEFISGDIKYIYISYHFTTLRLDGRNPSLLKTTAWSYSSCMIKTRAADDLADSKIHGAIMGPIWGRQDSGRPHVGPMNLVIWVGNARIQGIDSHGMNLFLPEHSDFIPKGLIYVDVCLI